MANTQKNSSRRPTPQPSEKAAPVIGGRGIVGLVLTLLCPPLGLIYLWRDRVFALRGRLLVSLLAAMEMTVLFSLLLPVQQQAGVQPVASQPSLYTHAPESDVANALSNLEELLNDTYATPEPETLTEEEQAWLEAAEKAELDELLDNTIVYSVYSGAKYYHAIQDCGQKNTREMTLREALAERLAACNECSPAHP